MSTLTWFFPGVVHELKANCYSFTQSRMAKDKKSFSRPPIRSSANSGGHSPFRSRRVEDSSQFSGSYGRHSGNWSNNYSRGAQTAVPIRRIPCITPPRELFLEIYLLAYLLVCLTLQNLNIYKQNWYLIDQDLVVFSSIVLGRTVLWRLLTMIGRGWSHASNYKYYLSQGVEMAGKVAWLAGGAYMAFELLFSYSLPSCFSLAYPVFLYTSLFGFTMDPHQERLRPYRSSYPNSPQSLRVPRVSTVTNQTTNNQADASASEIPPKAGGVFISVSNDADKSADVRQRRNADGTLDPDPAAVQSVGIASTPSAESLTVASTRLPQASGGVANSSFTTPPRSSAQALTSSLLTRTLLPWRTSWPEAVVMLGNSSSVVLSADSSHHMMSSPNWVRQEVECLWADITVRIKQILFKSVLCAYYAGFLPMQVVKHEQLYFHQQWCWMHTAIILCSCFLLQTFMMLPAQHCVSLYKCAVQLGFWQLQTKETTAAHTWSAMSSWPRGALVRHNKSVYRAAGGQSTVAIPGDEGHESFYLLFTWALHIPLWCCVFALMLLAFHLYFLWHLTDYVQSLTVFLSLVFALYPYFHLAKGSMILFSTALKS